jgi:hypothetical protein
MDSVLNNVLSLCNQYITKNIETGDKLFDTSLVGILSVIIGIVLKIIWSGFFSISMINKILYWYYWVLGQRDPLVFNTNQYYYEIDKIKKYSYAYLDNNETQMIDFISEILDNRSLISINTDSKDMVTYRNNRLQNSHQNFRVPIFYDGTDMGFFSGNVSTDTRYGSRYVYVYAEDTATVCKIMTYLKLRLQESKLERKPGHNREQICIYEVDSNGPGAKSVGVELDDMFTYRGTVSTKKVFDNIYYDQKSILVDMLTRFQKGKMYPENISMCNKLGIMLHGPPGTGKTGTISAIANMLQRNVLMVNFAKITKRSQLDDILREELYSKVIYVFDEFDCILDVLVNKTKANSTGTDKQNKVDWTKILRVSEGEERKEIMNMMLTEIKEAQESVAIDLGYLLQKLDGLESANNRIIIATTNNPEYINPVLLRPGRFDIKLELGNCSQQMYIDILCAFFGAEAKSKVSRANLPAKKYSPLQVINTALTTNDLEKTLRELCGKYYT